MKENLEYTASNPTKQLLHVTIVKPEGKRTEGWERKDLQRVIQAVCQ